MFNVLLVAVVDIETRDAWSHEAPLLKAASMGRTRIILLLLKKVAKPHATKLVQRNMLNYCMLIIGEFMRRRDTRK